MFVDKKVDRLEPGLRRAEASSALAAKAEQEQRGFERCGWCDARENTQVGVVELEGHVARLEPAEAADQRSAGEGRASKFGQQYRDADGE